MPASPEEPNAAESRRPLPPVEPAGEVFQALYRRFRPQTFAELRGQEHVALALRNAVRQGRVAHAYLFSGPRGTGKTSSARILAKALNCAEPVDGQPCGRCESCLSIAAGTSLDVHELDAASSNGVDAMRELVGRAALTTPGRWKVYIVDEVHMLSTAASNALLKTLEEPPGHVVFVLATTEPQKVLPTIRSRTQHYEFHLLADDVIDGLLSDVARSAGLELPPGAIDVVTRRARGSARDALSALDQVAAAGVLDDDSEALGAVVAALAAQDTASALLALDAAVRAGRDAEQIAVELVERLRGGFLALVSPQTTTGRSPRTTTGRAGAATTTGARQREEAEALGLARCVRTMELLGAALVAMRDAPEPRITLELALIRGAHPQADESPAAILERLEQLERRVAQLDSGSTPSSSTVVAPAPAPSVAPRPEAPDETPSTGRGGVVEPGRPLRDAPGAEEASSVQPSPGTGRPALGSYRRRATGAEARQPRTAAPVQPGGAQSDRPEAALGRSDAAPVVQRPASASEDVAPRPSEAAPAPDAAPSRDDLVAAWGDQVLPRLAVKLRAYYAAGRFRAVERDSAGRAVAVFVVPNAAHVAKAEPLRPDVERALSQHFGQPLLLRLEAEQGEGPEPAAAGGRRPGPRTPFGRRSGGSGEPPPVWSEPDEEDLEEVAELFAREGDASPPRDLPPSGLAWAEGRLLEAFPGAEEVGP